MSHATPIDVPRFRRFRTFATAFTCCAVALAAPMRASASAAPVTDDVDAEPHITWHERDHLSGDWQGHRDALRARGFDIDLSFVLETGRVISGGQRQQMRTRTMTELGITWDPAPLTGWEGVRVFASAQTARDREITGDMGSVQGVSAWETGRSVDQISEIWLEQDLADGLWMIRLGKIDAGMMFGVGAHGDGFLADIFTVSPTILNLPVYPESAFGGVLSTRGPKGLDIRAGIFDGSLQEGVQTGSRGPSTLFGAPADLFLIGETGITFDSEVRAAVGAWRHTGRFDRFDGGERRGTNGLYALIDLPITRSEEHADACSLFARYGYASGGISEIEHHIAAGIAWTGMLPGRPDDTLNLGLGWARLTRQTAEADLDGRTEWLTEVSYRLTVLPSMSLTPGLIAVMRPSGGGRRAIMGGLRMEITF